MNCKITVNENVKCPNCGESYYNHLYTTSTMAYYPTVYKDGMLINNDVNERVNYCRCMNCNTNFSYKS